MPEGETVADSSCLIALQRIDQLTILAGLYREIHVPRAVAEEYGDDLPQWIRLDEVVDRQRVTQLRSHLGAGESEAIILAAERSAARVILDDKKARRIARERGVSVTGTIAVLIRAKKKGIIPAVRPLTEALAAEGFRASARLVELALREAGEL